MSSNLMRISLDCDQVVPEFSYLNTVFNERTREQIRCSVNSGGREVANTAILDSLVFAWPPILEQVNISAVAAAHTSHMDSERTRLEKLQKIKAGLMQDLLTGKVRVTSLLTEPQEAGA